MKDLLVAFDLDDSLSQVKTLNFIRSQRIERLNPFINQVFSK